MADMNIADVDTYWIERGFQPAHYWKQLDVPWFTYEIRREQGGHAVSVESEIGTLRGDDFADKIHADLLIWFNLSSPSNRRRLGGGDG